MLIYQSTGELSTIRINEPHGIGIELASIAAMLRDRHVLIAFSRQPSVADFMKQILEEAGYAAIASW